MWQKVKQPGLQVITELFWVAGQMSHQWQGTSEGSHWAGEWRTRWQMSFSGDKAGDAARGKNNLNHDKHLKPSVEESIWEEKTQRLGLLSLDKTRLWGGYEWYSQNHEGEGYCESRANTPQILCHEMSGCLGNHWDTALKPVRGFSAAGVSSWACCHGSWQRQTRRDKQVLSKSRDSRIQILIRQKEKVILGMCHLPSLTHQL